MQRPGTFLCYENANRDVNARQRKTKEDKEKEGRIGSGPTGNLSQV